MFLDIKRPKPVPVPPVIEQSPEPLWLAPGGAEINADPTTIAVELIGLPNAGKTLLVESLAEVMRQCALPSWFQFGALDPRREARQLLEEREKSNLIRQQGLPSTVKPRLTEHTLYEGARLVTRLQCRDLVGQLLTTTTPEASREQQAAYETALGQMKNANVLWVVLACPPSRATPIQTARFQEAIRLANSWLRAALAGRVGAAPCAVAVVLTKLDLVAQTSVGAQSLLADDRLRTALGPLVPTIIRSERVADAAIFPVTVFGWNNAVPKVPTLEEDAGPERAEEPVYILKPGACLQPFNVGSLVLWSVLTGIMNQEVRDPTADEREMVRICNLLQSDLEAQKGWILQLKGQLGRPAK